MKKIKIVVPISGGKDSQACLKLALAEYDKSEVMGLFCDTQFEHPLTYAHIDDMREMYGVKIERVCAGSVQDIVLKFKQFPTSRFRMCTDRLKMRPSKEFYRDFASKNGGFQVWLGMRTQESNDRKLRYAGNFSSELIAPHDMGPSFPKYLEKMGVMFRLPVIDWSESEILNYLGDEKNPLYSMGSDRVGCFPCLASGDRNKERDFALGEFGAAQRVIVAELEKKIGRSIFTSKGGAMRNNENQDDLFSGCAMCAI
jgi:3'-phosphoadenosine 5'-phosphosulfate sulfotransferase (PAPS reductase)/FAD synthetase